MKNYPLISLVLAFALFTLVGCSHDPHILLGKWQSDVAHSMSWNDKHAKLSKAEEAQFIELLGNMEITYREDGTATIEMKPHILTYGGQRVPQPGYRREARYKILSGDEFSLLVQLKDREKLEITNQIHFVGTDTYWIRFGKAKANGDPREYFTRIGKTDFRNPIP